MKLSLLLKGCATHKDVEIKALSSNPRDVSAKGTLLACHRHLTHRELVRASHNGAVAMLMATDAPALKGDAVDATTLKGESKAGDASQSEAGGKAGNSPKAQTPKTQTLNQTTLTLTTGEQNPPHSTLWAQVCAKWWHNRQPENVVAITGTNGKSSVASFIRQLWQYQGLKGASIGTLGIETENQISPRPLTTQDPLHLHQDLAMLHRQGITHLGLEASSHGLAQRRLDGVRIKVGVFTNLAPEHLDYHRSLADYFEAKARLFKELKPEVAVIHTDHKFGRKMAQIARQSGAEVLTFATSPEISQEISQEIPQPKQKGQTKGNPENQNSTSGNHLTILALKSTLAGTRIRLRLSHKLSSLLEGRGNLGNEPATPQTHKAHKAHKVAHKVAHKPATKAEGDKTLEVTLPVVGEFQAFNAVAALLACGATQIAKGATQVTKGGLTKQPNKATYSLASLLSAMGKLKAPCGRMEQVPTSPTSPTKNILVDYCHNEDGLTNALTTLKPLVPAKGRLVVVVGCGGDRDASKRAKMGRVAALLADRVFVTDDNPRSEDPAKIRHSIIQGIKQAKGANQAPFEEIADRRSAILTAILALGPKDILLIAGKGHESVQITANGTLPFSDIHTATAIYPSYSSNRLASQNKQADKNKQASKGLPPAYGISIDSRTTQVGDLFIALKGKHTDGAKFLSQAAQNGAVAAIVADTPTVDTPPVSKTPLPIRRVKDPLKQLWQMAKATRAKLTNCQVVLITGSYGKTTVKDYTASLLAHFGATYATKGNFNNLLGVPLSLASTPIGCRFAVFEAGMNRTGELTKLNSLLMPQTTLITGIGEAHSKFFDSINAIAEAKAEALAGVSTAILPQGVSGGGSGGSSANSSGSGSGGDTQGGSGAGSDSCGGFGGSSELDTPSDFFDTLKAKTPRGARIISFGVSGGASGRASGGEAGNGGRVRVVAPHKLVIEGITHPPLAEGKNNQPLAEGKNYTGKNNQPLAEGKNPLQPQPSRTLTLRKDLPPHNVMNIAAAVALASNFGTVTQAMVDSLPPVPKGRGNKLPLTPTATLIDHSYNAAPASMEAALRHLASLTGKQVAVIAPMGELADPAKAHTDLARLVARLSLEEVFLTATPQTRKYAELMAKTLREAKARYTLCDNPLAVIPHLESLIAKQHPLYILLKASNAENLSLIARHFAEPSKPEKAKPSKSTAKNPNSKTLKGKRGDAQKNSPQGSKALEDKLLGANPKEGKQREEKKSLRKNTQEKKVVKPNVPASKKSKGRRSDAI